MAHYCSFENLETYKLAIKLKGKFNTLSGSVIDNCRRFRKSGHKRIYPLLEFCQYFKS